MRILLLCYTGQTPGTWKSWPALATWENLTLGFAAIRLRKCQRMQRGLQRCSGADMRSQSRARIRSAVGLVCLVPVRIGGGGRSTVAAGV